MEPTIDLRALLVGFLTARLDYDQADRSIPWGAPDEEYEARCNGPSELYERAKDDLRAAVLRGLGVDPRYSTPRPVVALVDGFAVAIIPDPDASLHPDAAGRLHEFGWRQKDIVDVARREDVLLEDAPLLSSADLRPVKRANRRRPAKGGRS